MTNQTKPDRSKAAKKTVRRVVGGVAIGLIVALLIWLVPKLLATSSEADPNESVSPAPSASSQIVEDSSALPEVEAEEAPQFPDPQVAGFAPVPLGTGDAVGGQSCKIPGNSGAAWRSEISSIAGVPYTSGMSCRIVFRSSSGSMEFVVPQGATRLTATAGQLDDAENTTALVRFDVTDVLTGAVLARHDLRYGEAAQIDVPIAGLVRVALTASMLEVQDDPWSSPVRPAFAEPTFR